MSKNNKMVIKTRNLITALLLGLFSSCISNDETVDTAFQKNLGEIASFVQTSDIVSVREETLGNTGIVLLFTQENPSGEVPVEGDSLFVDYIGYLLDGTVFDTSIEQVARDNNLFNSNRDYTPYFIKLAYSQVIPGWHFALSQMKEEEQATALIPSRYGFGQGGQGNIGPNAVVAFDLELVEVRKQ